jgi:hypothetical protein
MNLKLSLYLLFIFSFTTVYSQKLIVNKYINVEQTILSYKNDYAINDRIFCYDVVNSDTITVYVAKPALEGYTFKVQLINGKVIPKVSKCTDYPAYDGKSCVELNNLKYTLEINDTVFKPGDTLKVKFTITTKKNKYSEKKKVTGEIFHIIGGNMYDWNQGKSYHNRFYKNGKSINTTNERDEKQ